MPPASQRTTVMVSATIPPAIRTAAEQFLQPAYLLLSVGVVGGACSDVAQRFLLTARQEKKGRLVAELRRAGPAAKTLVFVRTKFRTQKMAQQLAREGFRCTSIHGDRSQVNRGSTGTDCSYF
jgi:superfamily II DNA/RNA helicase